jgi:hypothetical protein
MFTFATGYAVDKLTELGERIVRKHVIERWTRRRAIEFYRAFCATLQSDNSTGVQREEMLDELLGDEARSEIVFEAYRLVCLAKSRAIGPRIIAVVVAEIVQRDGVADEEEEAVLSAAEGLSDGELLSIGAEIKRLPAPDELGHIVVTLDTRQIDSNLDGRYTETGQGSLVNEYGPWAEKLKSLGLLGDSVTERTFRYREDAERHIDMDGSIRESTWKVDFQPSFVRLARLLGRVSNDGFA